MQQPNTNTGLRKVLPHLKGLVAALWPAFELYQSAMDDGAITQPEMWSIGKAAVFAAGVWLVPNLGYFKPQPEQVPGENETAGRHEMVDTDHDGVDDREELRANEGDQRWNDAWRDDDNRGPGRSRRL